MADEDDGFVVIDGGAPASRRPAASLSYLKMHDPARWHGRPIPERKWVVENWIPIGEPVLLTGHGGLGKSILMMQLLFAASCGAPWLGMGTHQCKAWGIFCEDDDDELHRRSNRVIQSMGMEFPDFEGWCAYDCLEHSDTSLIGYESNWDKTGKTTGLLKEIHDKVHNNGIKLLILDSLYNFFEGNENDRPMVQAFVSELKQLARQTHCAVVMIGHPSKSGLATGDGTSGSTAWHNAFRSRLYLHPPKGIELDDVDNDQWELTRLKGNYAAKSAPKVTVEWSDDGVLIPVQGRSYLETSKRDHECESMIMATIKLAANKRLRCPYSSNSQNAPWNLCFRLRVTTRDYSREEMKQAADRLFADGKIEVATMSDGSGHKRETLAEVEQ